mmetsp:Transcript_13889/g.55505  ORF Transcript_13889/g.55505 Transcript_13889/m.55505 type:complete len:91 (+) Transcript_13889:108-380(+)
MYVHTCATHTATVSAVLARRRGAACAPPPPPMRLVLPVVAPRVRCVSLCFGYEPPSRHPAYSYCVDTGVSFRKVSPEDRRIDFPKICVFV